MRFFYEFLHFGCAKASGGVRQTQGAKHSQTLASCRAACDAHASCKAVEVSGCSKDHSACDVNAVGADAAKRVEQCTLLVAVRTVEAKKALSGPLRGQLGRHESQRCPKNH